ncbi:MAG: phosphoenolpyruvate synthase [Bacteroidaceae bacterium]|nr:phosphoenolpyruvate synthase [Bacteroidaceae bacterium]
MEKHLAKFNPFLKDTSFVNLMARRVFNVLLVANPYDAFMLEDDGRIDEKIFEEYTRLGLRYPPRFTQVSTEEEATQVLEKMRFELVICMPGTDNSDAFDIGRGIKGRFPDTPLVVLTPFSHGITRYMERQDLSLFEYVFCWLGNTELLLSIIKLMEDKMNLDHDIREGGVQMILLVEDSIRFYSSVLPNLYKYVLEQSRAFATEALNAHQTTLRMRGRPKIVLARNYEEAWLLYSRYPGNTLGVISDVRFPMIEGGEKVADAGVRLLREIRRCDEFVPLIVQTSESDNHIWADELRAGFVDKNSKKMNLDLRDRIEQHFGFGDLIFRNPSTGDEVARIHNLKELQDNIFSIPDDSFVYHTERNHISRWLCSRAMFPLSEFLKRITQDQYEGVLEHRQLIFDAIVRYRRMKNRGVVAEYLRGRFDRFSHFARIGEGSLGGKGRGIAFVDHILKKHPVFESLPDVEVRIPKTLVLCTDIFDHFMESGALYQVALSDAPDETILQAFLAADLPDELISDIQTFCEVVSGPVAVRSSSLLEDSHYQPYAGVYATYMIPHRDDPRAMALHIADAIKGVYASVYYSGSKAYMSATSNVIDQEKMAIILQEVVGDRHGNYFYPHCSGVARSINFYPVGEETADEGVMNLALGLGKHIVDGGKSLRVSPAYPDHVLQTSEPQVALKETQSTFLALDLEAANRPVSVDESFDLVKLSVRQADVDGVLDWIASTYVRDDDMIYDTPHMRGRKLVTFAGVLRYEAFPLAKLVQLVLQYGANEMRRPVEVEFAVRFGPGSESLEFRVEGLESHPEGNCQLSIVNCPLKGIFYPLQIRPIVSARECIEEDLTAIPQEELLLYSSRSLGNGIVTDVHDIIYLKAGAFGLASNRTIATEIAEINRQFAADGRGYILVGEGRWGSSDEALGVPVEWADISAVRLIAEVSADGRHIEPSQGTHFFQNLTSFGVGYLTIDGHTPHEKFDRAVLDAMPAQYESALLRHVHSDSPFVFKMDGLHGVGVVMKAASLR